MLKKTPKLNNLEQVKEFIINKISMDKKNETKSEYKNEIIVAIISVVVIIFLWLTSWYLIDNFITPNGTNSVLEARGTFGDKFGAINSLFAGLAFAGIIFTILLQRKELQLQRDELSSTRGVFEKQNDMLSQEKFESTYFQMLSLFHSIVNSIDIRRNNPEKTIIKTGRDCFETFYKELNIAVNNLIERENNKIDLIYQSYITKDTLPIHFYIEAYELVYIKHRSDLSHYFRTFYHIIKLIDNSDLKIKKQYTSIARAQLSSYEQILLFYNCLHQNGSEKFKPLIERYSLFKNIDYTLLFSQSHLNQYEQTAYKS
jgi:hypothetical protein